VRDGTASNSSIAVARATLSMSWCATAHFRDTGGWGFDEFVGDSRVDHAFEPSKTAATCFTCHTKRRENGYVFTTFTDRDRGAA